MTTSLNLILIAAAGAAAIAIVVANSPLPPDPTELVTIPAGSFAYRASGEYLHDGVAVNAPLATVAFDRPLAIMKRQVSAAEYQRCVDAGACAPVETPAAGVAGDFPVVGIDWHDATAYAAWLSNLTGRSYRLPTDAEWAYAAGTRFADDAPATASDPANPAKRWIALYEKESAASAIDPEPRAFGSVGTNTSGLVDVAGNVWEWTDSCYVRHATHGDAQDSAVENCGVRVVEGSHRTYMSDFIRNPRGGACSVGAPPSNFGIRLVRDDDDGLLDRLIATARRLIPRSG